MTRRRAPDLWLGFWITVACCLAIAVLLRDVP